MKAAPRLKVLHVVHSLGVGGAETWLMELLRLWSKDGERRMDFLATSGAPGVFDDEARRLGAEIHYLRYGRAHWAHFARDFRRLLRHERYCAIHDHADYASGWHFLIGAGLLPQVRVSHVHNPWLHIEANYAVNRSRRLVALLGKRLVHRLATHVCGTSGEILRRYGFEESRARGPRVCVVHCGIHTAKFNQPRAADRGSVLREFGWPESARIALFAGRLDRAMQLDHPQNHKNSWFALNVARAAALREPRMRLLMAGAGEARKALEDEVERWGLQDRLRLIGLRDDIPRLMRAADALFFPSRQEGLGMVAVEAQAACLPVLASTAVPGECVVVPELYDALSLAEPIERWAGALLDALAKPRAPLERCRRALETSEFSIARSAQRLEAIYRQTGR